MPSDSQKIRAFMQERWIPSESALAAWILQVGEAEAAKDSGLPKASLQAIAQQHYPNGPDSIWSPERFGLGCVVDDEKSTAEHERLKKTETEDASIESLGIPDDANLPREHRINVPIIDESTNQGNIGSCVSWAGAHVMDGALANAEKSAGLRANPSCIYGFIKGHHLDAWPTSHGSNLSALSKALTLYGAPSWESMPVYRSAPKGNPANLPHPAGAIDAAKKNRIQAPHWIESWTDDSIYRAMCLMHGDQKARPGRQLVVCTAFHIPASFFNAYTAETGIVMMPPASDPIKGGHAVVFIGWKHINDRLYLIVKNSWGTDFGDGGYLYVPAAFVKKYFKGSFVIPALAREKAASPAQPANDRRATRPIQSVVPAAAGLLGATLVLGAISLLLAFSPFTSSSAEATPSETEAHSAVDVPANSVRTETNQAEHLSQTSSEYVLEIYSETLLKIDEAL